MPAKKTIEEILENIQNSNYTDEVKDPNRKNTFTVEFRKVDDSFLYNVDVKYGNFAVMSAPNGDSYVTREIYINVDVAENNKIVAFKFPLRVDIPPAESGWKRFWMSLFDRGNRPSFRDNVINAENEITRWITTNLDFVLADIKETYQIMHYLDNPQKKGADMNMDEYYKFLDYLIEKENDSRAGYIYSTMATLLSNRIACSIDNSSEIPQANFTSPIDNLTYQKLQRGNVARELEIKHVRQIYKDTTTGKLFTTDSSAESKKGICVAEMSKTQGKRKPWKVTEVFNTKKIHNYN